MEICNYCRRILVQLNSFNLNEKVKNDFDLGFNNCKQEIRSYLDSGANKDTVIVDISELIGQLQGITRSIR